MVRISTKHSMFFELTGGPVLVRGSITVELAEHTVTFTIVVFVVTKEFVEGAITDEFEVVFNEVALSGTVLLVNVATLVLTGTVLLIIVVVVVHTVWFIRVSDVGVTFLLS